MTGVFPLLRMPPTVLTTILQSMDKLDQVSISFVSKRTKALVVSLNLEVRSIHLRVTSTFDVLLFFGIRCVSFVLCQDNNEIPAPLTMAHSVTVNDGRRAYHWTKERYGIRDWIDHLMTITHASKIDQIQFSGQIQTFKFESIQNVIQGLEITKLVSKGLTEYQEAVLEAILMKNVSVRILPNQNLERLSKVFMQNYDFIEIDSRAELKLNELLIINSRVIYLFTETTDIIPVLNQFLKLWKTGSSPRLEYLRIFFLIAYFYPDVNIILKGIKHTIVAQEIQRTANLDVGGNRQEKMITGGFDIQGMNGKKATIYISPLSCEIFVLPR